MARPRKQTYTLEMYLKKTRDGDIDNSADVQRKFVWQKEQINGLIRTVLTDSYIPPIILGEEDSSQLHIVDGGQRTAALKLFRYGNYKINSTIEDSVIPYKKKTRDESGKIIWEDAEFDIKNKTYDMLPEELKKIFNEYQLETVIHEHCDKRQISKYIKIYNQQVNMNVSQKAYTYIYNYAEYINRILERKFFIDCSNYTESEKTKGATERVVMETVMCMFHLDKWKKQTKQIAQYLNDNSSKEEFEKLDSNLQRLENIITDDVSDLFNSKDSFIFLTLFNRFSELGIEDVRFVDMLKAFKNGLKDKAVDCETFDQVDKDRSTKDKKVVMKKLHILETLMYEFLHIDKEDLQEVNLIEFVQKNVDVDITEEDIEQYKDVLDDLTLNVDNSSRLMDRQNIPSLITIVAYSFKQDIDLDDWIVQYFNENDNYILNQKENYLHMKECLDKFVKGMVA